jgi:hypothetical protein
VSLFDENMKKCSHWKKFADLDPDPHWSKSLDPDPYPNPHVMISSLCMAHRMPVTFGIRLLFLLISFNLDQEKKVTSKNAAGLQCRTL